MSPYENLKDYEIRVTNILYISRQKALFSAVPTEKRRLKTKPPILYIEAKPKLFEGLTPCVGQHWLIDGGSRREQKNFDGYTREVLNIVAQRCEFVMPEDYEAMIRFIATDMDFAGIGENKARDFVETFIENPYKAAVENSADKIATDSGLTLDAAFRIKKGFDKYKNLRHSKWLASLRLPLPMIARIIKYHGDMTIDLITKNPYKLMGFGLSFEKTDFAAKKILVNETKYRGASKDIAKEEINFDERRLKAVVEKSMIDCCKNGDTTVCEAKLFKSVNTILKDDAYTKIAIACAHQSKPKAIVPVGTELYQSVGVFAMEAVIAKRLIKLNSISQKSDAVYEALSNEIKQNPFALKDKQLSAVENSVTQLTSVITGGAGTGKTTVLRTVMRTYNSLGYAIQGVAVSGRAAMRLHESTGFDACTIAKYLKKPSPVHGEKYILIIDEASMLDVQSMFSIVTKLPDTAGIMLVGDVQQLPPIGQGRVFGDVIESKQIRTVFLDIIRRQSASTGIPEYSKSVISGVIPERLSTNNIRFHDVASEDIQQTVVELMKKYGGKAQVVGMTNSGVAGVEPLNKSIQEALNPDGEEITVSNNEYAEKIEARMGDRVIFTRNNYDAGVWNGTLGTVVSATKTPDGFATVLTDEKDSISINYTMLPDVSLSYAITVHKAQGSQFSRVIVVLNCESMADRSWLYTALTRAVDNIDIVCPKSLLIRAINTKSKVLKRNTHLLAKLLTPCVRHE